MAQPSRLQLLWPTCTKVGSNSPYRCHPMSPCVALGKDSKRMSTVARLFYRYQCPDSRSNQNGKLAA
jgi:hypothetical protein